MSLASRLLRNQAAPRLTSLDASFLYYEQPTALLHVGSVGVLDGAPPFDTLRDVIAARMDSMPRLRQRPRAPCSTWRSAVGGHGALRRPRPHPAGALRRTG